MVITKYEGRLTVSFTARFLFLDFTVSRVLLAEHRETENSSYGN
jgi:hypothetical protein